MSVTSIHQSSAPAVLLAGSELEPFQITRKQLNNLFNSPTLVRQMITAGWIVIVRLGKPGRETLYDYQSVKAVYARLLAGENPPPLPARVKVQHQEPA